MRSPEKAPKTDGVCYAWGGSAGCTPTSVLAEHGAIVGTRVTREGHAADAAQNVTAAVLAQDGISEIEFVFANRRATLRAVENNALLWTPPELPTEARWTNPDGTTGSQRLY